METLSVKPDRLAELESSHVGAARALLTPLMTFWLSTWSGSARTIRKP
jgi:hypothetical protein